MDNKSDILMLSGVAAHCTDCGGERIFVPVDEGCAFEGCEFCCTGCDAAVFFMRVPESTENTATRRSNVA